MEEKGVELERERKDLQEELKDIEKEIETKSDDIRYENRKIESLVEQMVASRMNRDAVEVEVDGLKADYDRKTKQVCVIMTSLLCGRAFRNCVSIRWRLWQKKKRGRRRDSMS